MDVPAESLGRRRTSPEELAEDRPPDCRQPGESHAAYRCFLSWLEHGTIRVAAERLGRDRRTMERYSRRWRWPERARCILALHAVAQQDFATYDELHDLPAAQDARELSDRKVGTMMEVTVPRQNAKSDEAIRRMLAEPPEDLLPDDFDPEKELQIIYERLERE